MTRINQPSPSASKAAPVPTTPLSSKIAAVLGLLQSDKGAKLEELVAATSWQPHTARAVLSGLKKKGHNIEREKVDGVSRYRITKAASS